MTDRLVKARTHASLNQAELAQLLGISARTVKRYESGRDYKRGIILGWALACGVDPGWLETGYGGELPAISTHIDGYEPSVAA